MFPIISQPRPESRGKQNGIRRSRGRALLFGGANGDADGFRLLFRSLTDPCPIGPGSGAARRPGPDPPGPAPRGRPGRSQPDTIAHPARPRSRPATAGGAVSASRGRSDRATAGAGSGGHGFRSFTDPGQRLPGDFVREVHARSPQPFDHRPRGRDGSLLLGKEDQAQGADDRDRE